MGRKSVLLFIFSAMVLILAACGGGEQEESEGTDSIAENAGQETTETEEATTEVASSIDISASNWEFDKEEYVVKAGEPITLNFTSEEGVHGIGIEGTDINIQQDQQEEVTLEPGEYKIYCNVPCGQGHADMTATIIVQ
jgi:cytochrome c oxidase subunit II